VWLTCAAVIVFSTRTVTIGAPVTGAVAV